MTGSLQVKNDKFYIIVNLKEDGERKQKWIATGLDVKGNKRKAEQLLRETLVECEKNPRMPAGDILFSDNIRARLKVAERRVDSVTLQGYKLMANAQVIPYFDQSGLQLQEAARTAKAAYRLHPCGNTIELSTSYSAFFRRKTKPWDISHTNTHLAHGRERLTVLKSVKRHGKNSLTKRGSCSSA